VDQMRLWIRSRTHSGYQSVISAATLRLLGFKQNVTIVHVRGCTGAMVNTHLLHFHALAARR